MSGFIKVSGAQRVADSAYVKVSGDWKPAKKAFVKVGGTWREWFSAIIRDTFDRSNASSLGTTSNQVATWTATTGSWAIASNRATTSTAASSYPLATVEAASELSHVDVRVDIPSGAGPGVAFWVTNTNNWWAAVTSATSTSTYSCPNGGTLSGTTCNTTTTTFSPQVTVNSGVFTPEYYSYVPELLYTYQGYQPNGLPCDTPSLPECSAVGGSCINGTCQEYGTYYACSGGGRFVTINGTPTCEVLNASTCTTGGSDPCRTSSAYPACPDGGTRNGDFCTVASSYAATETVTVSNSTRILKNTSGTVATMATFSHSAAVRSIKVVTSNNDVVVSAYSAANQASLLNSNTYTAASPTTTAVAGIIVAPSSSGQSATLDNFYLK
jgi:hypothetical protein